MVIVILDLKARLVRNNLWKFSAAIINFVIIAFFIFVLVRAQEKWWLLLLLLLDLKKCQRKRDCRAIQPK
jgi:large-conductance mechanosensitive channel